MTDTQTTSPPSLPGKMLTQIWRLAITPSTFVVLALLWCLDLGLGSIGAYYTDPNFSAKMDAYPFNLWLHDVAPRIYPNSLWVYILVALTWLMIISLLLCSINWLLKRRRRYGLGEFLVHCGFLLIFGGFVVGAVFGERQQGVLVPDKGEQELQQMGLRLRLDGISENKTPDRRVLDTISNLEAIHTDGRLDKGEVSLNHPLISKGIVIYPRGMVEQIIKVTLNAVKQSLTLSPGQGHILPNGDRVILRTILQKGQRRGTTMGPGILLLHQSADRKKPAKEIYLSTSFLNRSKDIVPGIPIRLTALQYQQYGRYDVHHDPGIGLVFWGTALLAIGTVWAFTGYISQKAARK